VENAAPESGPALMKTGCNSDVLRIAPTGGICCALGKERPLKRHEEGRKAGIARRRNGPLEARPKSSFPSLASVPRSDLHHAPAIRPAANAP